MRILMHIGQSKSGTTALQHFLAENREKFEEAGIGYYPQIHKYNPWGGLANAGFLVTAGLHRAGWTDDPRVSEEKMRNLREEEAAFRQYVRRFDTVILSEEMLWSYDHYIDPYWEGIRDYLRECCGEDARIDAVVYLRRQDRWALSHWKESLRSEFCTLTFPEKLEVYDQRGFLDYLSLLQRLERAFGREHLILRPYDRVKSEGKRIYRDFMESTGLGWSDEWTMSQERWNDSLNFETAMGMRWLNRRVLWKARINLVMFYSAACEYSWQHPDRKKYIAMDPEEVRTFLKRFAEDNRIIEERYLDGTPFTDDSVWEGEVIEPQTRRDMWAACRITVKKWRRVGSWILHRIVH